MAVREMHKHTSWYMKGVRDNAKIRNLIKTIEMVDDLTALLNGYANEMMAGEQVALV